MAYIVEQHSQIQINQIRKYLKTGRGFRSTFSRGTRVEQTLNAFWEKDYLIFEWFKDGKILTQKTHLTRSKTNFGGERLWWICPKCSRNCGALFDFGGVWWCRTCGGLKYQTASGSKSDRVWPAIDKLAKNCQYRQGALRVEKLEDFNRPKWMRKEKWE